MDSLAAHAQAAVSGSDDKTGTFAVKVPAASAAPRASPLLYLWFAAVLRGHRPTARAGLGRGLGPLPWVGLTARVQTAVGLGISPFRQGARAWWPPCVPRPVRAFT